jgi:hypothetical protein
MNPEYPHFYRYIVTDRNDVGRFVPLDCPIDFTLDERDYTKSMILNGWYVDRTFGSEFSYEITVYQRAHEEGDAAKLVELSDYTGSVWMCLVPLESWPLFYRTELFPFMAVEDETKARHAIEHIRNALISIARHGIGVADADRNTGHSKRDYEAEQAELERFHRRQEMKKRERETAKAGEPA